MRPASRVLAGFYEGVHFHRVIPGFMNQFGCPHAKDPKSSRAGTGGPPDGTFKNLGNGATEKRSNGGNIEDENISKDSNAPGTPARSKRRPPGLRDGSAAVARPACQRA